MTPAEDATLNRSDSILAGSRLNSKAVDQALIDIEKEVRAIGTPPPATVDLKPVLDAIAAVKADVDALAARVANLTLKAT